VASPSQPDACVRLPCRATMILWNIVLMLPLPTFNYKELVDLFNAIMKQGPKMWGLKGVIDKGENIIKLTLDSKGTTG
jgi:hypothetical protein